MENRLEARLGVADKSKDERTEQGRRTQVKSAFTRDNSDNDSVGLNSAAGETRHSRRPARPT